MLDQAVSSVEAFAALIKQDDPEREAFTTELVGEDPVEFMVKSVEKSGWQETHKVRKAMFDSSEYRQFLKIHGQLIDHAGVPPFTVQLGDQSEIALSFEELRSKVMEVCQKGIALQRFKGLGEMNPDQLSDTTMDPAMRTLAKVTMEDASAADKKTFSMLMGDHVEARRNFIEENARLVTNLDV